MILRLSAVHREAILYEDQGPLLLNLNPQNQPRRLSADEATLVEESWADCEPATADSLQEAVDRLRVAHGKLQALYLVLFALDSEMDRPHREQSASAANSLMSRFPDASPYVGSILCAEPLPESADINTAIEICRQLVLQHVEPVLSGVKRMQVSINAARSALGNVDEAVAGNPGQRHHFQSEAARLGLFASLAKRINSPRQVDLLRGQHTVLAPDLEQVFNAWIDEAVAIATSLQELADTVLPDNQTVPTKPGSHVSAGVATQAQDPFQL